MFEKAYLAVDVEDKVAVINCHGPVGHKPCSESADPDVEACHVACEEEQELDKMVTDEGVPQPSVDRPAGLMNNERVSPNSNVCARRAP